MKKILSVFLALSIALMLPISSLASPTLSGTKHAAGFSVPYSFTIVTQRRASASFSCNGVSTQNPTPVFINGSIRITLIDEQEGVYNVSPRYSVSADYGEPISLTKGYSLPSGKTIEQAHADYSFVGVGWGATLLPVN